MAFTINFLPLLVQLINCHLIFMSRCVVNPPTLINTFNMDFIISMNSLCFNFEIAMQKKSFIKNSRMLKTSTMTLLMSQEFSISSAANVPARTMCVSKGRSESTSGKGGYEANNSILWLAIIDILQYCDISKRLEHACKSLQVDPTSVSVVDPKL